MTEFELYRGFIESVCHAYGIDGAIAPLQEGIKVLEEAHKDRTTGGNWFGKTLRDQNNFDRQLQTDSRHDIDPTKTAGITSRGYADHCVNYLNGHEHVLGNMFVAKRDTANKYCEFLFKSMYTWFRLQQKMGIPVEGRICGYMSEFLFGAYIDWFKLRTKTIHLRMT